MYRNDVPKSTATEGDEIVAILKQTGGIVVLGAVGIRLLVTDAAAMQHLLPAQQSPWRRLITAVSRYALPERYASSASQRFESNWPCMPMSWPIETIEAEMIERRDHPVDVVGAFEDALRQVSGGQAVDRALRNTAIRIGRTLDEMAAARPEPAYHDRFHMAEATYALALLCREAVAQALLPARDAAVAVVAMAGHDVGHDGSPAMDGVLERQAQAAVHAMAASEGVCPANLALMDALILATTATEVPGNYARLVELGGQASPRDILRVLVNEADVFASFTPNLGPRLSLALAEEWRGTGNPALLGVGTAKGRLGFLRAYPALSKPATVLGLQAARDRCITTYAQIGARSGMRSTPEDGSAALDRLPPAQAATVYADALASTPWPGEPLSPKGNA